jgi:ribosomal 50S subunit-recycling heat shock protein
VTIQIITLCLVLLMSNEIARRALNFTLWLHFILSGVAALSVSPGKARVDSLLVSNGLANTRVAAKKLLAAGVVTTNCGAVITKASKMLACDARLTILEPATADELTAVSAGVPTAGSDGSGGGSSLGSGVSEALTSGAAPDDDTSIDLLATSVEAYVAKPERPQTAAARSALRGGAARASRLANHLEVANPATASEKLRTGGGRHHAAKRYSKKNKRGTAV